MIIVKSPFRISFFGGSTDYKDFYQEHGSFIIGTTINKNTYLTLRKRPSILSKESVITYSQMQRVTNFGEINNPLIREIFKFKNITDYVEFNSFSDIPSRTGLGGSSSFCVGMLYLLNLLYNIKQSKLELIQDAIKIERYILNESGGIQDQIWPVYGGLNTIEINKKGDIKVKPLSVTDEFKRELESSMILIYTNEQREEKNVAKSHEEKNKKTILDISLQSHSYFLKEDIKSIGNLMYEAWKEKRNISNLISSDKIDNIVETVINMGAYGAKLLGSGGSGFVLVICDPLVKENIKEKFKDKILEVKFNEQGVSQII